MASARRKQRPPTLTRKIMLSVLPKAKGKPIATLTAHIRVRRRSSVVVQQRCIAEMLRRLAADGFIEKSKVGIWCMWRLAVKPPRTELTRRSSSARHRGSDPELRAKRSEEMFRRWSDPEFRLKHSEALRRASSTAEVRAKRSEIMRRYWDDPEARAKGSAAARRRWSDPEYRSRQSAAQKERHARRKAANKGKT